MASITDLPVDQLINYSQFDNHVVVRYFKDEASQLEGVISLHRASIERPAFGATRMATYPSIDAAIADALTLARFMSYKSALAGLPYWGAKAVILQPSGGFDRSALLRAYAEVVNTLDGTFVTGADLGIFPEDVEVMKEVSPHMVGVSNDPVYFTAYGILESIREAVRFVWSAEDLAGRSFAIQGVGKIGEALLRLLYPHTQQIVIADVSADRIQAITKEFPFVRVVGVDEILSQEVDVLCPCAHGGVLSDDSVDQLRCRVVLGGANSQLASNEIGDRLLEREILFVPDYVVNAGGLISVVDEYLHHDGDINRVHHKVLQLPQTIRQLFTQYQSQPRQLHRIANQLAEDIFSQYE